MTPPPLTLRQLAPRLERPEAPEPGERIQLDYYFVEAKLCTCCKEPVLRYFLRNVHGEVLVGGRNWARMCHFLGVYEIPAEELWPAARPATLKKAQPAAAPAKPTPPTRKVGAAERAPPKQEGLF